MKLQQNTLLWYKEPGVWLLLTPLIVIFFVCSILVGFAVSGADDRISDDYYKEGKMINRRFAAEAKAKALGLKAELKIDAALGDVLLSMHGSPLREDQLQLYFSHPARADMDFVLPLSKVGANTYRGELDRELDKRWYLRLEPLINTSVSNEQWRLSATADFSRSQALVLE